MNREAMEPRRQAGGYLVFDALQTLPTSHRWETIIPVSGTFLLVVYIGYRLQKWDASFIIMSVPFLSPLKGLLNPDRV